MNQQTTSRGTYLADVLANERLCDEHYRMVLSVADLPPSRAGQFVQLMCRPPAGRPHDREVHRTLGGVPKFTQKELTESQPLLRRPLSLAGRRDFAGGAEIEIIYRTVGAGTHWMASVDCGAVLSVLGPLGRPFGIDADRPAAALVGGGVGIPPLLYLSRALAEAGRTVTAFAGARTASLMPLTVAGESPPRSDGVPSACLAEFAAAGAEAAVTTDDGSMGFAGFVSEPFIAWLDAQGDATAGVKVYTCGPEPMMRAVADACVGRGVACEVSLERNMACGMGTCQSCICKTRAEGPDGWRYQLCCTDGPTFNAANVIWD